MNFTDADESVRQHELRDFGNQLRCAEEDIQLKFVVVGRTGLPVGTPAAMTRSGEIETDGVLPSGAEFSLHGVGCLVVLRDGTEVDFDWDEEDRQLFDGWRFSRFLQSRGWTDCGRSVTRPFLERAASVGVVNKAAGAFYYFR